MAKVEFSSGNWVEYRENLKASDRFAVQDAVSLEFKDDGSRRAAIGLGNDIRNALLGRIITGWSYPSPVPSQQNMLAADVVIGEAMDLDDYNELSDAVQALVDKISGTTTKTDPKKPSTD